MYEPDQNSAADMPLINPSHAPKLQALRLAFDRRRDMGRYIRAAREELGVPAVQLAKWLDVPRSRISEWETGKVEPRLDMLERIVRRLSEVGHNLHFVDLTEDGGVQELGRDKGRKG